MKLKDCDKYILIHLPILFGVIFAFIAVVTVLIIGVVNLIF